MAYYGKNAWKIRLINASIYTVLLGAIGGGSFVGYSKLQPVLEKNSEEEEAKKAEEEKERQESIEAEKKIQESDMEESKLLENEESSSVEQYEEENTMESDEPETTESEKTELNIAETKGIEPEESETTEADAIHEYYYYVEDTSWDQAYEACIANGGHLVTFDSDEEYQYVLNEIEQMGYQSIKFYIGARRELNLQEYRWLNKAGKYYGDVLNDSPNWMQGEPSIVDVELQEVKGEICEEYCVNLFFYADENRWVWNDIPSDLLSVASYYSGRIGYICEIEK